VFSADLLAGNERPLTNVSQKGSLLLFPSVQVGWRPNGEIFLDTAIELLNDYTQDVRVQLYFVNGDPPMEQVIAGDPPEIVSQAEPGWNFSDCMIKLTANQVASWSAARGMAGGCAPFTVLDPDGRPDPERSAGHRMLRGYVLAWAVNNAGEEIRWNHLSGHATTLDYHEIAASEYAPYAFRVRSGQTGAPSDARPGLLLLNGREYDALPDTLLWTFEAAGVSRIFDLAGVVSSNTDLTLMPVESDFRHDGFERVTTTARYDIWNENEQRFSGTQHELTCWHQKLLSEYPSPNHLVLSNLQTNRGKARIRGVGGTNCGSASLPAPIVGVAERALMFAVTCAGTAKSSATLKGEGCESGAVLFDPSGLADNGLQAVVGVSGRSNRTGSGGKKAARTSSPTSAERGE